MKKKFLFLFIGFLLAISVTANADTITDIELKSISSSPTGVFKFDGSSGASSNVYLDYGVEIKNASADSGIINGTYEAFCVENANASSSFRDYTVLDIDNTLSGFGLSADDFFLVSEIAEEYYLTENKAAAQVAIWEIMFDSDVNLSDGNFLYPYNVDNNSIVKTAGDILTWAGTLTYDSEFTSNWVLAVNPTIEDGETVSTEYSQNYIFRAYDEPTGPPVPEPSVLLLLGTGLLSVAASGRKRFMK